MNYLSHWVYRDWWAFLLEHPRSWRAFWCRARGHPHSVVWFNPCGNEPNMDCKNCGDDLG